MGRGHQHADKKHRASKTRRANNEHEQRWGGLKPIITGALGDAKSPHNVSSVAHRPDKKRAA